MSFQQSAAQARRGVAKPRTTPYTTAASRMKAFSKRRLTIINLLSRLNFFCGSDFALITTSPTGVTAVSTSTRYSWVREKILTPDLCDQISAISQSQDTRNQRAGDDALVLQKTTGKHLVDICLLLLNALDVGVTLGTRQLLQNILYGFKKSKDGGRFQGYKFNRPRRGTSKVKNRNDQVNNLSFIFRLVARGY